MWFFKIQNEAEWIVLNLVIVEVNEKHGKECYGGFWVWREKVMDQKDPATRALKEGQWFRQARQSWDWADCFLTIMKVLSTLALAFEERGWKISSRETVEEVDSQNLAPICCIYIFSFLLRNFGFFYWLDRYPALIYILNDFQLVSFHETVFCSSSTSLCFD